MKELLEILHTGVLVKTYGDIIYHGTLIGIDQNLNTVLQDVVTETEEYKASIFIKGSNILYIKIE